MASTVSGARVSSAERAPETQDWLNRHIFHPLARRVALASVPAGLSPNLLSLIGLLLIVGAALSYGFLSWPLAFLIGFPLHLLWHVFDGADGDLARLTGKSSSIGELVDGVCDYAGHVFLYLLFGFLLDNHMGLWAWAMVVPAGVSRIVQSNFAESQRRIYLWRVYDVPWLQQNARAVKADRSLFVRVFGIFVNGYVALAQKGSSRAREIDDLLAAFPQGSPSHAAARALVRDKERQLLPLLMLIGQNSRTVMLGLSMATGTPIWFFIAEFTLLNVIFFWASMRERRCSDELAAKLRELSARSGRLG